MEFNEKLQKLRKQKGLTQEELAEALFISRTAVSKWESGRGYPSIDSLKVIANFFSVTIDDLLSCGELLQIAQVENKRSKHYFLDMIFGLLDISMALYFFLPLFAEKSGSVIKEVSILMLNGVSPYLKVLYFVLVAAIIVFGILTLTLQNCSVVFWRKSKRIISFGLGVAAAFLFMISLQPYAATVPFVYSIIKVLLLIKK